MKLLFLAFSAFGLITALDLNSTIKLFNYTKSKIISQTTCYPCFTSLNDNTVIFEACDTSKDSQLVSLEALHYPVFNLISNSNKNILKYDCNNSNTLYKNVEFYQISSNTFIISEEYRDYCLTASSTPVTCENLFQPCTTYPNYGLNQQFMLDKYGTFTYSIFKITGYFYLE